jgi:hypothetical protein
MMKDVSATSDERRATSDERRATSDERRATSDERRATSDDSSVKTKNVNRRRTVHVLVPILLCCLFGIYSNIISPSGKSSGLILESASSTAHHQQQQMAVVLESNLLSRSTNDFAKIAIRKRVGEYLSGNKPPLPPRTPGAFIHVGKTGGSTLSRYQRNGCHSFVPKPCRGKYLLNESYISKTTTYSKSMRAVWWDVAQIQ